MLLQLGSKRTNKKIKKQLKEKNTLMTTKCAHKHKQEKKRFCPQKFHSESIITSNSIIPDISFSGQLNGQFIYIDLSRWLCTQIWHHLGNYEKGCIQAFFGSDPYHAALLVLCWSDSLCERSSAFVESVLKPTSEVPIPYALHSTCGCNTLHTNGARYGLAHSGPHQEEVCQGTLPDWFCIEAVCLRCVQAPLWHGTVWVPHA